MFRISSTDFAGRRALIVDEDDDMADQMSETLHRAGACVSGRFMAVDAALSFIAQNPAAYCVLMHVDQADVPGRPLIDVFHEFGAELIFVAGFDDWFASDDEGIEEISLAS